LAIDELYFRIRGRDLSSFSVCPLLGPDSPPSSLKLLGFEVHNLWNGALEGEKGAMDFLGGVYFVDFI
jgi:hypothetical protein